MQGPPEFLTEIAHSTWAIDLHAKYDDCARRGVLEYLVVCLEEREFRWFDLVQDCDIQPDADDVYRVRSLPGLWINRRALLDFDHAELLETLNS